MYINERLLLQVKLIWIFLEELRDVWPLRAEETVEDDPQFVRVH